MSQRNTKVEESARQDSAPRRRRQTVRTEEEEETPAPAPETPVRKSSVRSTTKSEPKVESKTESKTESKIESKTESKKTETKPEVKTEEKKPRGKTATAEPQAKTTAEKKKPTEEELRKKFLDDLPQLVKKSMQNSTFLKAWNPKNPLTTGGMAKRLKDNQHKTGDDELVYSLELAITGTRADFEALFKESAVQQLMQTYDLTADKVRDNFITFENYDERKEKEEFQELQNVTKKHHTEFLARINLIKQHFVKPTPDKVLTKQQRLIVEFDNLRTANKVYDVSGWVDSTKNGFKRIPHPSTKSQKKCMKTYPICSADRERMEDFLTYLGLSAELSKEAFD